MKVNLFNANINLTKGEKLATVELEVVPGGTYVIDGTEYTLVGKPTFHIDGDSDTYLSHRLVAVDLLVQKIER